MSVQYGTRIVSPPELDDLRQVLGDGHLRLENLGVSPNINPFSKHKFVRYKKLDDLTEEELRDTNYGLQFHTAFAPDLLEQGYEYLRPDGVNWHFRLDDMIGYEHKSSAPMRGYGDIVLRGIASTSHTFWFMGRIPSIYDLTLGDFPALENFYPCLAIFSAKGLQQWKTAENKFGEAGDKSIAITYNELNRFVDKGPYTYLLCGFSAKQTSFSSGQFGQFISLPTNEDLAGTITLSNTLDVTCDFLYIKNQIQAGENTFQSVDKYSGLLSIDGSANARFGVMYNGDIALVARITNNESSALSFYRTRLKFNVFPTIVEKDDETIAVAAQTYEMTMNTAKMTGTATQITQNYITIAPGQTRYIGFNLPGIALQSGDGTAMPVPGQTQTADMNVSLRYDTGTGSLLVGSIPGQLRVTTGLSTSGGGGGLEPILPDLS